MVDTKLFKKPTESKIALQATIRILAHPTEFAQGPVRLPIRELTDERGPASIRAKPFWRICSWAVCRCGDRLIQTQQWSCIIACDVHFVGEDLLSPCPNSSLKIDGAFRYSRAVCSSPRNHVTLFPVTREDEIAPDGLTIQGGLPILRFLSSRIDIVRRSKGITRE